MTGRRTSVSAVRVGRGHEGNQIATGRARASDWVPGPDEARAGAKRYAPRERRVGRREDLAGAYLGSVGELTTRTTRPRSHPVAPLVQVGARAIQNQNRQDEAEGYDGDARADRFGDGLDWHVSHGRREGARPARLAVRPRGGV
jgi:hypothetical protein